MGGNVGRKTICYFVGTHGDWGGASRIIFNIVRNIDRGQFEPVVMLTSEGEICEELQELAVEYVLWEHKEHRAAFSYVKHLIKCLRFYSRYRVNVVSLSYGCLGWRPAELLAAKLLKIPVIQHCQQIVRAPSPYTKYSRWILTCSDFVLEKSAFVPARTQRIYDIVDVERFGTGADIRRGIGLDDSHIVITFLGRKRKSKGLDMFVALSNDFQEERIRFLVAGQRVPKPNRDSYSDWEFDELIAKDDRIQYVGYQADVENIYAASDIIVMPSQGQEPCPAVTLEAAASGRPIVATDTGATRELVVNNKTGLLVPKGDYERLVDCVKLLATNSQLREDMGREAMVLARERFFREPIKELQEIYETL